MAQFFFPYIQDRPATVSINGHKLVIVSSDRCEIEESLVRFGADTVWSTEECESKEEFHILLHELADTVDAGVIITPEDTSLSELIEDLEAELPWLQ